MGAIGGSIEEVTINGRVFAVAADADVTRQLGGFNNEKQSNGNGSTRTIKTRVPWQLNGLTVNIDDSLGDHEFLQNLANLNDDFAVSITYLSGEVYQGTGQITGELVANSQNTLATVNLQGPGELTRQ